MKKVSTLILAAAGLTLASCSQDDLSGVVSNGDGNYTVQITIPKTMASRAVDEFGTGLQSLVLKGAVYDNGTYIQPFTSEFPAGQLSTTVDFNLVKNKSYKIAFFAQSQTSITDEVYTFDAETSTISVAYENMKSESNLNDAYDCFLGVLETGTIGTTEVKTSIILNRPVAQVNWGTNDLFTTDENGNQIPTNAAHEKAYGENGQYIMTNLTVTNPYNSINFLTNEMTQATGDVVIEGMAAPYTMTFPLDAASSGQDPEDYIYVAMTYLLAPAPNSAVYDLNLNIDNGGEAADGSTALDMVNTDVEVSAVPVQANYQTNIYGNLLSENVQVTVTKNPIWEDSFNVAYPSEAPAMNSNGQYVIASQDNLTWMANELQAGNTFSGESFVLQNNIELTNPWTPIGGWDQTGSTYFKGTFDGQGYTITGLNVDGTVDAGFFGYIGEGALVQNLNIDGAIVKGFSWVGVLAGRAENCVIKNVNVTNSTVIGYVNDNNGVTVGTDGLINVGTGIYAGQEIGGLVGYFFNNGTDTNTITGCSVSDSQVSGYEYIGGLIGHFFQGAISNNKVTDVTLLINTANNYNNITGSALSDYNSGEVYGSSSADSGTSTGDTATGVTPEYGVTVAASQSDLQAAVATADAEIFLAPGTYTLPNRPAQGITISGTGNTVFEVGNSQPAYYNGVTFENITFNANQNYRGLQHSSNLTYKNCTLNGLHYFYSEGMTLEGCTFNQTGNNYCVWTYTATNVDFSSCTFNCDGKAVLVYNETTSGTYNISFDDCTFIAAMPQDGDGPGDGKAAIQINGGAYTAQPTFNVNITGCTATGFSNQTLSGEELWSYKAAAYTTVTVDGDVVYQNPKN